MDRTYKGYTISKHRFGGWKIILDSVTIEKVKSIKQAKRAIDYWLM